MVPSQYTCTSVSPVSLDPKLPSKHFWTSKNFKWPLISVDVQNITLSTNWCVSQIELKRLNFVRKRLTENQIQSLVEKTWKPSHCKCFSYAHSPTYWIHEFISGAASLYHHPWPSFAPVTYFWGNRWLFMCLWKCLDQTRSNFNSYSASHNNWCTATLWNRIMTAQCEGMGEVGSARYEPALLPPCPSIRALCWSNCQRSTQSHQHSKG